MTAPVPPATPRFVPHPAREQGEASTDPWTIVVLAWRPGAQQHRAHVLTLLCARYRLALEAAKPVLEESLEAPIDPLCLGAPAEREAREIGTTLAALGAEVRVVPGDERCAALGDLRAAWTREHPHILALHGPPAWRALAAFAADRRLT